MTKNTLEENLDILVGLAHQIPLKLAQIKAITHIPITKLKKRLAFLTKIGAIKVQTIEKINAYEITPYGTKILRFFKIEPSIHKINQNNEAD